MRQTTRAMWFPEYPGAVYLISLDGRWKPLLERLRAYHIETATQTALRLFLPEYEPHHHVLGPVVYDLLLSGFPERADYSRALLLCAVSAFCSEYTAQLEVSVDLSGKRGRWILSNPQWLDESTDYLSGLLCSG